MKKRGAMNHARERPRREKEKQGQQPQLHTCAKENLKPAGRRGPSERH